MLTKKCGLILKFLLLPFVISAQFKTTDFELTGKVKSVQSVCRPYYNSGKTAVSGFLGHEDYDSVFLSFDKRRNLVLRENYLDYKGKLGIFDRTINQINPSNLIEKSEITLIQNDEEPRKIAQRKRYYYLKNQLIRMDEFNSGRTSDQNWTANSVYKNGVLSEKIYWMDDAVFSTEKFEFDKNYNPVSKKTFSNNGTAGLQIDYQNDKSGMPINTISQSTGLKTEEIIDYKGFYPSKITFKNGSEITKTVFYNPAGRVFEVDRINYQNQNIDIFKFEYEFDSENNWIRCEISKNGQKAFVISRTISYYP